MGIGAVVAISFFYKKGMLKSVAKLNPIVKLLLIIGLLLIGASLSGYITLPNFATTPTGQGLGPNGQVIQCATFGITPTVTTGNGVLNTAKDLITSPFLANTSSHGIRLGSNATWVNPVITFLITPEAYAGATALDLAVLHYEVVNPSQTVSSASSTYYILTKSSDQWQAVWTGDGTKYVTGTVNMLFTTNQTLVLTLTIDTTGLSYTQSTYTPQTLTVRFYNDCGWSHIIDIDFICTHTGTSYRLS